MHTYFFHAISTCVPKVRNYGDFRQHVIPVTITCMLRGTPCYTGISYTFYRGKICSVLVWFCCTGVLISKFYKIIFTYFPPRTSPFLVQCSFRKLKYLSCQNNVIHIWGFNIKLAVQVLVYRRVWVYSFYCRVSYNSRSANWYKFLSLSDLQPNIEVILLHIKKHISDSRQPKYWAEQSQSTFCYISSLFHHDARLLNLAKWIKGFYEFAYFAFNVSFIPFFIFGFWSLLAKKLQNTKN